MCKCGCVEKNTITFRLIYSLFLKANHHLVQPSKHKVVTCVSPEVSMLGTCVCMAPEQSTVILLARHRHLLRALQRPRHQRDQGQGHRQQQHGVTAGSAHHCYCHHTLYCSVSAPRRGVLTTTLGFPHRGRRPPAATATAPETQQTHR